MIKDINHKRIEEVRTQLQKIPQTDPFLSQNIINCHPRAVKIAKDLFGEVNDYCKALDEATKLSPINHREIMLKVLDSMSEALFSGSQVKETPVAIFERAPQPPVVRLPSASPEERDQVFIVHGRDDSTKEVTAKFLEELGLEPIILHEQPNKGRTIIEKFEDHSSNVKYAVVLLTPDDLGGLKTEPNKLSPRARQNVVFEMGHFFGSLGRRKVCALLYPEVERPSDIDGIMYISLDKKEEWKGNLFLELKAAKLKLRDWIDPRIEMLAEASHKDAINFSLGRIENIPWTMLDEKEKERYRQQAMELVKNFLDRT